MKKTLALSKKSFLTSYPHYANISSILLDDDSDNAYNVEFSDLKTIPEYYFKNDWFEKSISDYGDEKNLEPNHKICIKELKGACCNEGDVTGQNDSFKFIYSILEGNGGMEFKIDYQKNTSVWAKAGLMFRENLTSDSRYISIFATPSVNGIVVQMRESTNEVSTYEYLCDSEFPARMKIERNDSYVKLYCGDSLGEWIHSRTIPFSFDTAVYMGIALCTPRDNAYKPWFVSNFIQMYCYKDFSIHANPINFNTGIYLNDDFYSFCPYLRVQNIKYSLLKKNNVSIVQFIIEAIDDNNYVDVLLDEFYVPQGKGYKEYTYYHGNMIYGYDLQNGIFELIGYNENNVIRRSKLTFREFESAFVEGGREGWYREGLISIFKIHPYSTYDFNINIMLQQLSDYVNSIDSLYSLSIMQNCDTRIVHGISVYDYLIRNISSYKDDMRPLHIIWEHKKIMLFRLKYLKDYNIINMTDFDQLYSEYSLIEQLALKTRNLQLKNKVRPNDKNISKIKNNIEKIKIGELNLIPLLIKSCIK
ncbi:hypothetical protein MHB43_23915 [Paenibacillus sp. FSL H8-0317]|uniref:hypothetical protein n=1 Tax=Paenibacillus sp. FSL H8-0317 TaxID=2921385 RepID=UPI00324DF3A9